MPENDEEQGGERTKGAYDLYHKGMSLLDGGDHPDAVVHLERARSLEPDKSSIREALGRAYFHLGEYTKAEAEFRWVVETHPLNHYAQFCLGRSLEKLGEKRSALHHISIANQMKPDSYDYKRYRARLKR